MVKRMKEEEFKTFSRKHGLKVSKEELVSRVFAAKENNIKPVNSA